MNPLLQQIVGGCVVALFVAALGLMRSTSKNISSLKERSRALEVEFRLFKEFFMRTAERRDQVVKTAERWRDYALRVQGIDRVNEPPAIIAEVAACERPSPEDLQL